MLQKRKEICTFDKLKKAVQEMCRRYMKRFICSFLSQYVIPMYKRDLEGACTVCVCVV